MGHKTYYFNQSTDHGLPDGQTATIRINAQVDVYDFVTIPQKFVSVSLNGSNVAASQSGKLGLDRSDKRGFFTESAIVTVSMSDGQFFIEQDSPGTTMGSEATSSTTSIGVNVSAGTFGPTPTTNIGGGVTIGSSFSRNLSDFRVVNNSSNTTLSHTYKLASSTGAPYSVPKDLLDMSVGGQLTGVSLFTLPDIAISNLNLASQAIFLGPISPGSDPAMTISIEHRLVEVEKTFEVFEVQYETWDQTWTASMLETIPMATQ